MTNTAQTINLGVDQNTIEAIRPFLIAYGVYVAIVLVLTLVVFGIVIRSFLSMKDRF
jgi:hypothetical protein